MVYLKKNCWLTLLVIFYQDYVYQLDGQEYFFLALTFLEATILVSTKIYNFINLYHRLL